jgi:hypothetical protein
MYEWLYESTGKSRCTKASGELICYISGHRLGSRRVVLEVSGNGNALDLQTADETLEIGIF